MNPKHTVALLLIAVGAFLILVGGILGGVALADIAHRQDQIAFGIWFALAGTVILAGGLSAFLIGVRVYRRSDHRMPILPGLRGGTGPRFPLLAPMSLVLLAMITLFGAFVIWSNGADQVFSRPRARWVAAGWALLVVVVLVELGRKVAKRRTARQKEATGRGPVNEQGGRDQSDAYPAEPTAIADQPRE